jgi:hypothetical protein
MRGRGRISNADATTDASDDTGWDRHRHFYSVRSRILALDSADAGREELTRASQKVAELPKREDVAQARAVASDWGSFQ